MPKKSRARKSMKQTQKQEQRQNISIKIGELPTKKRRRRPRKGPSAPGREAPMRQLPPVVYQTLPQLTYYGKPNESGNITAEPIKASTIVEPVKAKTSILEDVGQVGTEGRVEILERPTKRETLAELITPVEQPTISQLFREQKQPSIVEPKMQQFPITEMEIPTMSFTSPIQRTRSPLMEDVGVESVSFPEERKTAIIADVIRETSPLKQKRTKRTKAEMAEARSMKAEEKQRAKSVPAIPRAIPAGTIVDIYPSEKYVAEKPRTQSVKKRSSKKPEGTIIPTQEMVTGFFTPRMQPFVSEKAGFFENLSSASKPTRVRATSPKPKALVIGEAGPTIKRKPRAVS